MGERQEGLRLAVCEVLGLDRDRVSSAGLAVTGDSAVVVWHGTDSGTRVVDGGDLGRLLDLYGVPLDLMA